MVFMSIIDPKDFFAIIYRVILKGLEFYMIWSSYAAYKVFTGIKKVRWNFMKYLINHTPMNWFLNIDGYLFMYLIILIHLLTFFRTSLRTYPTSPTIALFLVCSISSQFCFSSTNSFKKDMDSASLHFSHLYSQSTWYFSSWRSFCRINWKSKRNLI